MMMKLTTSLLVLALSAIPAVAAPKGWEKSPEGGIQSCNPHVTENSWFCVVVKCDRPKALGFYVFEAESGVSPGRNKFRIDNSEIDIDLGHSQLPMGHAFRASNADGSFFAALKSAKTFGMVLPNSDKKKLTVPMGGAGAAIDKIEKSCGA